MKYSKPNMKNITLIIILSWSAEWLVKCRPSQKINETIRTFHRTGQAIAIDDLIHKYENDDLGWPALDEKNLSNYCRRYLNHSVPGRTTDGASGTRSRKTLRYNQLNTNITCTVNTLQCRVMNKNFPIIFYLIRALEPNCVYALKSSGHGAAFNLTIINKYCDFDEKPLIEKSLKRKRVERISKIHRTTGQPIAKDDYLLEYELEFQELVNREGYEKKSIDWSHAMLHPNLSYYCYQYMKESAPKRNCEGVKGNWKTESVHVEKLNSNVHINAIVVRCQTADASKLSYYMTRAPETNCAYALLRQGNKIYDPMVIIFKHCGFEKPYVQHIISQKRSVHSVKDKDIISKTEVKEEKFETTETLQLFSSY